MSDMKSSKLEMGRGFPSSQDEARRNKERSYRGSNNSNFKRKTNRLIDCSCNDQIIRTRHGADLIRETFSHKSPEFLLIRNPESITTRDLLLTTSILPSSESHVHVQLCFLLDRRSLSLSF